MEEIQEQVYDEDLQANSWNHHREPKEREHPRHPIVAKSEQMRVPPAVSTPAVSNPNNNPNPNPPVSTSQLPMVSKIKRQALMGNNNVANSEEIQEQVYDEDLQASSWNHHREPKERGHPRHPIVAKSEQMRVPPAVSTPAVSNPNLNPNPNPPVSTSQFPEVPVVEKIEVAMETKKVKKGDASDEDVDIGDEMPMSSFPPVEIEDTGHNNNNASSSSSSSGSSSSDSSSSSECSDEHLKRKCRCADC
ncbi:hypothetical protein Dsin_022994 [Dipteronia sinensis]|uniref:Uncharacterized protein n=1 Tax=Dipteronia sinensis TaxID=43782 RepID=A0AAE0A2R4_9ROSI|nr:hypothetical protein Dsin_022994 [Dipteronia sinensis]